MEYQKILLSTPVSELKDHPPYLLIDNDVLGIMFHDVDIFNDIFTFANAGNFDLVIDPLSKFEFLRDVFEPKMRILKEAFVSKFIELPLHQLHLKNIQANALLLSKIYMHQAKTKSASFVDLMLAGRIMYQPDKLSVLTSNIADFPCVFKIEALLSYQSKDLSIRNLGVLSLDKVKLQECNQLLNSLEDKLIKVITE